MHTHTQTLRTQVFANIVQVTQLAIKEPWGRAAGAKVAPGAKEKDAPDVSTFSFGATTESQNAKV